MLNDDSEARFEGYVEALAQVLGHADRVGPFRSYCAGLLLPGERKSVEPMAARLAPQRTGAEHQSLLHFVGQAPWDGARLLRAVREQVLPALTASGPIETWIIDDTGFARKGRHPVGVGAAVVRPARQAGQLSGRGLAVGGVGYSSVRWRWPRRM